MDDEYFTVREAARVLDCTERTIYNHINRKTDLGRLFHKGIKVRVKRTDLEGWLSR